jgi:hypothetical protein
MNHQRRIRAGAVGVAVVFAMGIILSRSLTSDRVPADPPVPRDPPSEDVGIFAPAVGGYGRRMRQLLVRRSWHLRRRPDRVRTLGDEGPAEHRARHSAGMVERRAAAPDPAVVPDDGRVAYGMGDATRLIILHADGSETVVAGRRVHRGGRRLNFDGATISPTGRTWYLPPTTTPGSGSSTQTAAPPRFS